MSNVVPVGDARKVRASRSATILLALAIAAAAVAALAPVARNGFTTFDGGEYLLENPTVRRGLSRQGLVWAFTSLGYAGNWHPLTWLSHMLDVQLFGLDPRAHHLVSLGIHALCAALLFLALEAMTAQRWRSACAALLFAVHPLHVESVAWEMERKDVLSTLLLVVTLVAYARYARRPTAGRYALVTLAYVLGLLAKPMLVTLPFALLLLDFWPLGRIGAGRARSTGERAVGGLVAEKLPLLALAAASSVVTYLAQQQGGLVRMMEPERLWTRFGNAAVSSLLYIAKTAWPSNLAVFYPYQLRPWWQGAAAAAVLGGASAAIVLRMRRQPHLFTGWFWYLGTLVPVVGLVQVGSQAMADRYTYVPHIGLFLLAAWALAEFARGRRGRTQAAALGSLAVAAALALAARAQAGVWRDELSLYGHAVRATRENWLVLNALGKALYEAGRFDEAAASLREALRLRPNYAEAHNNLGLTLERQGRSFEAAAHFAQALAARPDYAPARNSLGIALFSEGRVDEAIAQYREVLRLTPAFLPARNNLGNALIAKGRSAEALAQFAEVLRVRPDHDGATFNYGNALAAAGRLDEAAAAYARALRLNPRLAEAALNLGAVRMRQGRPGEAVEAFDAALQIRPDYVDAQFNSGLALEATGRADEARARYAAALRLNPKLEKARAGLERLGGSAGERAGAVRAR